MPWFPEMRANLITFLLENSIAISLFGFAFLTIGTVMVMNFLLGMQRKYYEFKIGQHSVNVDEELVNSYLQIYFKELFPSQEVPCRLIIKQNRFHITADLPCVPSSQRSILLEKIKNDLNELFSNQLGYESDFYLSTSFQPEKK